MLLAWAGAGLLAVAGAITGAVATGGSGATAAARAVGFKTAAGVPVYGRLGPERVPLEVGPPLAAPNTGLTGATIDGIGCNVQEQLAYHHHVHLALFVAGHPYSVPLGVGMVAPVETEGTPTGQFALGSQDCLYWTHVHAGDGIVHIESAEATNFTLGQVMDIWHVPLTPNQLGTYAGPVSATVNGRPWTFDPAAIPLTQHAQIVVNVGGPIVTPPPIGWQGTGL